MMLRAATSAGGLPSVPRTAGRGASPNGGNGTTQSRRRVAAVGTRLVSVQVDVQRRVRSWAPRRAEIAKWASEALGRKAANREVSVRIVGRAESRRLNEHYRGKDYPTNVLSFPAPPLAALAAGEAAQPLGDLVICPPVLRAEAQEQKKTLRAHWAHLVVHGTLHLIGYDHERDADARRMERREIAVLRRLGFTNPYRTVRDGA